MLVTSGAHCPDTNALQQTMAHSAARTIIAPRLKLYDYLILRLVVPIMAYLRLSLNYTLVSLLFGLPFGGKYVSYHPRSSSQKQTRLM